MLGLWLGLGLGLELGLGHSRILARCENGLDPGYPIQKWVPYSQRYLVLGYVECDGTYSLYLG